MTYTREQLDDLRRDREALLSEVRDCGGTVRGPGSIRCPFADAHRNGDKSASGSSYAGDDGVWRFRCHGCGFCGDLVDVRARASNRDRTEVFREMTDGADDRGSRRPAPARRPSRPAGSSPAPKPPQKPVRSYESVDAIRRSARNLEATYPYTNPETGKVDLVVLRIRNGEGKRFLQFRPADGGEGFVSGAPPKPWPLYNRARVAKADEVVVVEGEKCVHALHKAQAIATTSPAGAGKAAYADWSPLAGKIVYLWPDNDEPGMKHMDEVAEQLARLEPRPTVYRLDPSKVGLGPKQDAADFLESDTGGSPMDAVLAAIDLCEPVASPSDPLRRLIEETIAGRRKNIPWKGFPALTHLARALLPGTVTVLWGNPGDGKSFFLLGCVAAWVESGIPCAYFELEEGKDFHLNRALSQMEGQSDLMSTDWMEANPEASMGAYLRHQPSLDRLAACIWNAPERLMTTQDLAAWVEARAEEGRRVIVVDPVTACDSGREPWSADRELVLRCKVAARRHGCSVVMVSHPTKGGSATNAPARGQMSEMGGGSSYSRHTQTILFFSKYPDGSTVTVLRPTPDGKATEQADDEGNRGLWVKKARNGTGDGRQVAMRFDRRTLRFEEIGIVAGEGWKEPEEPDPEEERRRAEVVASL